MWPGRARSVDSELVPSGSGLIGSDQVLLIRLWAMVLWHKTAGYTSRKLCYANTGFNQEQRAEFLW